MDRRGHAEKSLTVRVFTALVAYRTGRLAGRLAGCLAFTAAALFKAFLQGFAAQGFNMLHGLTPLVCTVFSLEL